MNAPRILHSINVVLWLIQCLAWGFYAHSGFMAFVAGIGAGVSLVLARGAGDGR